LSCEYPDLPDEAFDSSPAAGIFVYCLEQARNVRSVQSQDADFESNCRRIDGEIPFEGIGYRRTLMNTEQVAGNWKQLKGKVKEKWGKLTDDDLKVLEGKQEQLAGILEKRYGYAKERAEEETKKFYKECGCK
jgi:uncharacterized protein YjbJ (UPF0337 family)